MVLMSTCYTTPVISPARHKLFPLYATEAVNSIAAALITVGLPFYTTHRFGWGARENLAIAALQGVLYVFGALYAQKISRRWGFEKSLLALYAGMMVFAIAVGISASMGWPIAAVLGVLIETALMAASWPMLESLVSGAGEPSRLSKRLGCYNIVWASTGAVAVAASGAIIQHAPAWAFFAIVAAGHFLAGVLTFCRTRWSPARSGDAESANSPAFSESERSDATRQEFDEAAVRRHRLALWLSRIALPSTYVIVYSLAPVLPSLHAIKQLSPTVATLVASIWLIARAAAFAITGVTTFWHKRPGLMLVASLTMLLAFIGIIIPGTLAGMDLTDALLAMAIAQVVLGFSIGTIYSASLYFGMAVSDGSTEHGGYHEALIGLGQILGPLVGATMQWIRPDALWPAVIGISGLVSVTVVVQAIVGLRIAGGIGAPPDSDRVDA
jgi:MFS family permease